MHITNNDFLMENVDTEGTHLALIIGGESPPMPAGMWLTSVNRGYLGLPPDDDEGPPWLD